ncbi:MAG: zinc dependent phospholipase C family protein [Anaerolineales bacterium]|nr:zinc dependent phospholipase C family protein [Anaerolineales bacterium]
MPTPFNHLRIAADLLTAPNLPTEVRALLQAERPAFLLGNIAPDVQSITGELREATHFFPVPIGNAPTAASCLFTAYPVLAAPHTLPAAHAAFISGYLAHLEFDQQWVRAIFEPVFGPDQPWGTFPERLYLHNALRSFWDFGDLALLPDETASALSAARPAAWLPFVADENLVRWRDLIANQLHTGTGAEETLRVFAARMQTDAASFGALVHSPDAMAERVFSRVAWADVETYRVQALAASENLLTTYWSGNLQINVLGL